MQGMIGVSGENLLYFMTLKRSIFVDGEESFDTFLFRVNFYAVFRSTGGYDLKKSTSSIKLKTFCAFLFSSSRSLLI